MSLLPKATTIFDEDYTHSFENLKTKFLLTLKRGDDVVGTVEANTSNPHVKNGDYDMHIFWVEIRDDYQSKGVCSRMVKCFVDEVKKKHPNVSFGLENVGGYPSCRCYVKAFHDSDYKAYKMNKNGDLALIKLEDSPEKCKSVKNNYMVFKKNKKQTLGGKKRQCKEKKSLKNRKKTISF